MILYAIIISSRSKQHLGTYSFCSYFDRGSFFRAQVPPSSSCGPASPRRRTRGRSPRPWSSWRRPRCAGRRRRCFGPLGSKNGVHVIGSKHISRYFDNNYQNFGQCLRNLDNFLSLSNLSSSAPKEAEKRDDTDVGQNLTECYNIL